MTRIASLAAVALLAVVVDGAHAAVLCMGKGERLVVRETCRKRERPVDRSALAVPGPTGAPGLPGNPGAAATTPLRLIDANGTEIGTILFFHPAAALVQVGAPLFATPLLIYVSPDGFPSDNGSLRYTSTDCSGVALMRATYQDPSHIHPPFATVFGNAAYYATDPAQNATAHSHEYDPRGAACSPSSVPTTRNTCCVTDTNQVTNVVRTARVPLDGLGLVTPFRAVPR